jgi:hypothetical protein
VADRGKESPLTAPAEKPRQNGMALIGGSPAVAGPGFFVPTRNHELFAWCLEHGLSLVQQMTLMTIGLYNEPTGSYLPSVLY